MNFFFKSFFVSHTHTHIHTHTHTKQRKKPGNRTAIWPRNPTAGLIPWGNQNSWDLFHSKVIIVDDIVPCTWKLLRSEVKVTQSCLTLCDPMDYSPWNSPGQNTGVSSFPILQGIFLTQETNQDLLHCRQILYQLSYQEAIREDAKRIDDRSNVLTRKINDNYVTWWRCQLTLKW